MAAPGSAPDPDPRLRWGVEAGLEERIGWADVAVSAAGSTPYDLACAGVPSAVRAVAANQQPIERAFLAAGLARAEPAELLDPSVRAALAAAGPALIDGYGAFRARDGLLAAFAGQALPEPLRYRPVAEADADLLLGWRNEEHVRAMSRTPDPVAPADHARWLTRALADPDRTLLLAERGGTTRGDGPVRPRRRPERDQRHGGPRRPRGRPGRADHRRDDRARARGPPRPERGARRGASP